ncbi:hypothetical protein IFM89_016595 [Coptis chinensis]|uniref:Uncharacterized protein n=1 Tax=Coptis chinensis TaxID=261450 RepID=A0A835IX57_9MAGN|nr:hypothetical protein IFM89_016595 [Coptis chinensis]
MLFYETRCEPDIDALWRVIKSTDGMKSEINHTVESVYNRLLNPKVRNLPPRDPTRVPPGFAAFVKSEPPCDGADDDLDVLPGFG